MFWRFGFHSASAIDGILEREGVSLDDILAQEELLQEVKSQSIKLIDFLCKPANLEKLVGYIIADDLDEAKRFKYPFMASEIFGMEVFAICEAFVQNVPLLTRFWGLLEKEPPLNPLQASYFTKVNCVLFNKKTAAMIAFLRENPTTIKLLLKHLGCSAIADLVLKLISVEDMPEGSGIIKWISGEGLIPHLFSQLNPELDPETLMDIISVSYQSLVPPEQTNNMGQPVELPPSVVSGVGNILIDEMKSEVLLGKLFDYMVDRHAPNAISSLTNGVSIIMELIRKYCSEIEHAEMQQHHYQVQLQANNIIPIAPTAEKLNALAVDMNDLLHVLVTRLPALASFLNSPRTTMTSIDTTIGRQAPLGSERLKICELFAEILHLQYLFTSSPLFDLLVKPPPYTPAAPTTGYTQPQYQLEYQEIEQHPTYVPPSKTVVDGLVAITECFVQEKILVICIQLFFMFKWNNFLHSVVFDMIAKALNTYSYTSTIPTPLAITGPMPSAVEIATTIEPNVDPLTAVPGTDVSNASSSSNPGATVAVVTAAAAVPSAHYKMKEIRASVKKLVVSIFKDAQLMSRISEAQHQNDYEVEQPKGVRSGYMGHLTYIADEICKLFEKCGSELDDQLHEYIVSETWQEYVSHPLKETRDRDRAQLGGERPQQPVGQGMAFGGPGGMGGGGGGGSAGKFDDASEFGKSRKKTDPARDGSDDEDAGGGKGASSESDTFNDQFARYLCNQLVKDLPDRFLGGDSSDDDEEADKQWIGDIDVKAGDFDIAEAIQMDETFPDHLRPNEHDDETMSDFSSSKVEGEDDSPIESRTAVGNTEVATSATNDIVPKFGAAFSTKDLELALDAAAASGETSDTDPTPRKVAGDTTGANVPENADTDADLENNIDSDDDGVGIKKVGDRTSSAPTAPSISTNNTAMFDEERRRGEETDEDAYSVAAASSEMSDATAVPSVAATAEDKNRGSDSGSGATATADWADFGSMGTAAPPALASAPLARRTDAVPDVE